MGFGETLVLSALAGVTIFLGLPVARVRGLTPRWQAGLTTAAAGIILFLIWDVLTEAVGPVEEALDVARHGGPAGDFVLYAATLGLAVAAGLLLVTLAVTRLAGRRGPAPVSPTQIALGTALGLGLHNFSEGLAIGQSSATGATTLTLVLVIGFALHNATEGFAIAAPLGGGQNPSWGFLGAAGIVGGGPTFVGGVVGYSFVSPVLTIMFMGLAAGALIFVFNETMGVSRRFGLPMVTATALLAGLVAGFGTDFVLNFVGA
jgi:zinc transporter, ZIP family